MLFCMAEYCDTLQSKEERNREYKVRLSRGAILHLLDGFFSLHTVARAPYRVKKEIFFCETDLISY